MAVIASNKVFPLAEIEATDFAELIDAISPYKYCIMRGCAVYKSSTVGAVYIDDGQVLIRGRVITITGGTFPIPLPSTASATYYVIVECNISASTVDASASVVAVTSLASYDSPDVANFNATGTKTYLILAVVQRNQTEVTTVDTSTGTNHRAPTITTAGDTIRQSLNALSSTVSNHYTTLNNRITNVNTDLTTLGTTVNNFKTTANANFNKEIVLDSAQEASDILVSSLAGGANATYIAYPLGGNTYYPSNSSGTAAERSNYQRNAVAKNNSNVAYTQYYAQGRRYSLAALSEAVIGVQSNSANAGMLVVRGFNCVSSDNHVEVQVRNTGSAAATNFKITIKGYFVVRGKLG